MSNHAIFTTTKDRKQNIAVLCRYLTAIGSTYPLLIIDASLEPSRLDSFYYQNIHYFHCPGISVQKAFYQAGILARSSTLSFIGDDDFPVLQGLLECSNKIVRGDANVAFGSSAWIDYRVTQCSMLNEKLVKTFQRTLTHHKTDLQLFSLFGTKQERLMEVFEKYRVYQFAVLSRQFWLEIFNEEYSRIRDLHMQEIACSLAIACLGRHSESDSYFLIRGTGHSRPNSQTTNSIHEFPDLQALYDDVVAYGESLMLGEATCASFVAFCISLRILQYTSYHQQKRPISVPESIKKRELDIAPGQHLRSAIDTIIRSRSRKGLEA